MYAAAAMAAADDIRSANALGPANAPVLIEFFSDLQCPQCARYEPMVKSVRAEFGDKVRLVLRQFPLQAHQHALLASCAAEAAANQGKLWEMVEALYKTQWMWSNAPAPRSILLDRAKDIGLDLDRFQKDLDSPECHDRVVDDLDHGRGLGVQGAPCIVVNGYNLPKTEFNENALRTAIKVALAKATQ